MVDQVIQVFNNEDNRLTIVRNDNTVIHDDANRILDINENNGSGDGIIGILPQTQILSPDANQIWRSNMDLIDANRSLEIEIGSHHIVSEVINRVVDYNSFNDRSIFVRFNGVDDTLGVRIDYLRAISNIWDVGSIDGQSMIEYRNVTRLLISRLMSLEIIEGDLSQLIVSLRQIIIDPSLDSILPCWNIISYSAPLLDVNALTIRSSSKLLLMMAHNAINDNTVEFGILGRINAMVSNFDVGSMIYNLVPLSNLMTITGGGVIVIGTIAILSNRNVIESHSNDVAQLNTNLSAIIREFADNILEWVRNSL